MIVARSLGPEQYGVFSLLLQQIGFLDLIGTKILACN